MAFSTTSHFEKMADGTEICVNSWIPYGEIKGVVVLSHGMIEHSMRYDRFGSFLADNGFVFQAHDHRGHGRTAQRAIASGKGDFGYIAPKNGFEILTEDLHSLVLKYQRDFFKKPIILLGHSFGSFVAQNFIENYANEIDACILLGSAGPRIALMRIASVLAFFVRLFYGKKTRSDFLNRLVFGSYYKKIKNPKSQKDWLSRDEDQVAMALSDDWCGFCPTIGFFEDLFFGLRKIHKAKNIKKIPKSFPIFVGYGTADPVGDYGKTIAQLVKIYKKNGVSIDEKIYEDARHELLNEINHEEVEHDIILWLEKIVGEKK